MNGHVFMYQIGNVIISLKSKNPIRPMAIILGTGIAAMVPAGMRAGKHRNAMVSEKIIFFFELLKDVFEMIFTVIVAITIGIITIINISMISIINQRPVRPSLRGRG